MFNFAMDHLRDGKDVEQIFSTFCEAQPLLNL